MEGVWKLETVGFKNGKVLQGLIQSQTQRQIDFAEIVQRPGKPTFAIVRGIDPVEVARVEQLPDPERQELIERFRQLRNRAVIEAGRMEEVTLRAVSRAGAPSFRYDGDWFTLISTADEESTRRCIVRIEQIFRAFRTLLPPRVPMPRRLAIQLYASRDEMRQELKSLDLDLSVPAFYAPGPGRILAASELSEYARQLARVRREADEFEKKYVDLEKAFLQGLARLSGDLNDAGFAKDEIAAELNLRKAAWKKEKEESLARMQEQRRRNESRFAGVTGAMFRRLYHEALHAYLDMFVYPSDSHHVPQWLHEGLAQVFEAGQLEGDALRLDAPDASKLAQLQTELKRGKQLRLAALLVTEGNDFAGRHEPDASRRHYLYSWGIAHQLVFHDNLLSMPSLDAYVAADATELSPLDRFSQLVGRPLSEWESHWRASMLALPPPAR